MRGDWYIRTAKKIHGPLTDAELKEAASSGLIRPSTPVCRGSAGEWVNAEDIRGLAFAQRPSNEKTVAPRNGFHLSAWHVLGGIGGLVVLVCGLLIAFELGRRQAAVKIELPEAVANQPHKPAAAPVLLPPATRFARIPVVAKPPQRKPVLAQLPQEPPTVAVRPRLLVPPPPAPAANAPGAALPVRRVPANDREIKALETAANLLPSAKDVVALYDDFANHHKLTASQLTVFNAARNVWQARAKLALVRLGTKWVTLPELLKAQQEAAQLVEQAYEMAQVLNFAEALKTLRKASQVDPNAIAADFTLGLIYSLSSVELRQPPTADKHFHVALRRIPDYVPALNNLAIAEIRQRKYADAIRHLRQAAEKAPTSEEVTQNLGRFVSEAKRGRIHPSATLVAEATKLYSRVVTARHGPRSELRSGWLFIPFVAPKNEREALAAVKSGGDLTRIWDCSQGTGFVIDTHYVVTCRHVVDDVTLGQADRVEVIDPNDPTHQLRLPATIVSLCDDDDLALLKCDRLNASALSLASTVPPRGTEILVIGFPGGSGFGNGLKTTHGIVTAVPGSVARLSGPAYKNLADELWYDAPTSHGSSGGPVFEEHANVVAVTATGYRPGDDPDNAKYTGGVPAGRAIRFLRKNLPKFDPRTLGGDALKWADVDAKVSPSIVLLVTGYRNLPIAVAAKNVSRNMNAYDDRFCTACNGRGIMICPACNRGTVQRDVSQKVTTPTPFGPLTTTENFIAPHTCPVCGGSGHIRCPHCSGSGIDPSVR